MGKIRSGLAQKRRNEVEYYGYQFKDFLRDLLNERNMNQLDLAIVTKNTTKTVSEWATGLSVPSKANFQNIINSIAPTHDQTVRQNYINEKTATYISIRRSYDEARKLMRERKSLNEQQQGGR